MRWRLPHWHPVGAENRIHACGVHKLDFADDQGFSTSIDVTAHRWCYWMRDAPRYGHDLNPVELIWGNLKSSELANLCPDTIKEAVGYAEGGLDRIGTDPELSFAFLRHCGLEL